ncbi:MAG TPA: flagellar biosynthesis protein FliQ [Nitrospirae bacterium]|nr:flagellar biosynthetic protein FliQ [bacterium BMS3Abin06]HDH13224.1 flagellar biosynthesis protein FliQ [Nitrospirota bacterium]HDZ01808.1 flagellar biosynthesis protein FliQ [Nitrospirota bacterium]
MTLDLVKEISADVFRTVLYVAGPPLLAGLAIGLLVGFFQTITQIQEMTLTFVPKMLVVFACLFFLMPWMSEKLMTFTTNLITNIPSYIR